MRIESLKIGNYRKFESLSVQFHSQMNVIVGNNGAGKSTVLDALSIGIGSFFLGIEGIPSPGIAKTDTRYITREVGSVLDRQPQFPVMISCSGSVFDQKMNWTRYLNTESSYTTYKEAVQIKETANDAQSDIRSGDTQIVLPVISYYGTGRLWLQKKDNQNDLDSKVSNRFNGYQDCLSSSSNEKLMRKWFSTMTLHRLQEQIEVPELTAVEKAIAECFVDSGVIADKVKVRFGIKSGEMEIIYLDEDGFWQKHPFHELSDGFKNTMSLVADIAYRMAVLNPQLLDNAIKKTPGIVLIDEIDQHLHPKWQRSILKSLMKIFPKVQFIVTTHSPSVIASAISSQLIILDEDGCHYPGNSYGKDSNSILSEIMDVAPRPDDIQKRLNEFYQYLDEEKFEQAEKLLDDLVEYVGEDNSDVISARVALDFETS